MADGPARTGATAEKDADGAWVMRAVDGVATALLGPDGPKRMRSGASVTPGPRSAWAARLEETVDAPWFQNAIMALIIVNAVILGLQTSEEISARHGAALATLDRTILWIFVIEIALRIAAKGWRFFHSGWGWFDLAVVGVSLIPATGDLSILRAFRVLRVLRLLSISKKMRRVIAGFFAAIPGMATVIGVLAIVFYVSSVMATTLFGTHPDEEMQALFGTLGRSFFTLFQLMTLEDWAGGIVQPTVERFPYALFFFIPYIFVTAFAVLNLFIGIIVDAMQDDRDEALQGLQEREEKADQRRFDVLMSEMQALRGEMAALRGAVPTRDAGEKGPASSSNL